LLRYSPDFFLFTLGRDEFFAAKVWTKRRWDLDRTIGLLMVFKYRYQPSGCSQGSIQRCYRCGLAVGSSVPNV
jgi:hypothetical protein